MATIVEGRTYTLEDFNRIANSDYTYTIKDEVIDAINLLAQKVGAPTYQKTPNFNKYDSNRGKNGRHNGAKRRGKRNQEICAEDWEAIRNFQTTELEEAAGIDKLINNLRTEIIKISDTTYDTQLKLICNILTELTESQSFNNDEKNKVAQILFDVASSNKFYSELYSQIIFELNNKYEWLPEIFLQSMKTKHAIYSKFENADPNADYDKFCKINKDNENRKSLIMFYINLMKKEVITIKMVMSYLIEYKDIMKDELKTENTSIVEQLGDNLSIMIKGINDNIEDLDDENKDEFEEILNFIQLITNSKKSDHSGLTNKTIFIFMDLLDSFK